MKVLFSTLAFAGHLLPMIPLAHALAAHGHQVRVACEPSFAPVVSQTGTVAAPIGSDIDLDEIWAREVGTTQTPRMRSARMFDTAAALSTPALVDAVREWDADLLVFEPRSFAGPIAARATGIASVRHCWGPDSRYLRTTPSPTLQRWITEQHELDLADLHGDIVIEPAPAAMRTDSLPEAIGMRYIPCTAGFRDEVVDTRRRIIVTWSGTFVRARATLEPLVTILRGLADRADEVLLLIAQQYADQLGDIPTGVRVTSGVSLESQLPHADLLVHTGNGGPMMSAVVHGVPQLIYSSIGDSAINGTVIADAGAGITRRCEDIESATVRADVAEMLGDNGYGVAARALADANADEPAPLDRAALLLDHIQTPHRLGSS